MKAFGELLLVLGLATAGAVVTWQITGPPDRTPPSVACDPATLSLDEICLATVQAEWKDVLWIDARREEEWKIDGMPGSIHITTMGGKSFQDQIEASLERLASAQRAVVYCSDTGCGISKEVVKQLREYGLVQGELRALHGGYAALKQAGMIKDSSPAN